MTLRECCGGGGGVGSSGITAVITSGCLDGIGTAGDPLYITLDPTGLLACGGAGLRYTGPTGTGGGDGITSVVTSGCIGGSGITASPVVIRLDPTGLLTCGAAGLRYSGPTGVSSSSGITYVITSGCIGGSGTDASPVVIRLDPTGLLACGAAGLRYTGPTGVSSSSGITSVSVTGCITGSGTSASPISIQINPTGQIQCTSAGIAFSGPTGILYNGVITTNCISGNGLAAAPIGIRIDPTGLIGCGANGLKLLNAPAGSGTGGTEYTSLSTQTVGAGTHVSPVTDYNLVYNNASGTNTIDFRPLIYFNMGQIGTLAADGAIADQPRFICPEGFQIELCRVYLTIGNPGGTDTDVQLQLYNATEDCTEPTTNGTPTSKTITSGCTWVRWNEVEGIILDSLEQMTFRVTTPGDSATNLVCHFWARTTVCSL